AAGGGEGASLGAAPGGSAARAPGTDAPSPPVVPGDGQGRLSDDLGSALASWLGRDRSGVHTMEPTALPAFLGFCLTAGWSFRPGDEVVVPGNCPLPLLDALLRNGCVPVFADIDLGTGGMDLAAAGRAVGGRTRGLAVTHGGFGLCDMDEARRLCADRGLLLIEYSANVGSTRRGRPLGGEGDLGVFSFSHLLGMGTSLGLNAVAVRPDGDGPALRFPARIPPTTLDSPARVAEAVEAIRSSPARCAEYRGLAALCHGTLSARPEWFLTPVQDDGAFSIVYSFLVRPEAPFSRAEVLSRLNGRGRLIAIPSPDRHPLHHPFYSGIPHRLPGPLSGVEQVAARGITVILSGGSAAVLRPRLADLDDLLAGAGGPR
ncbi:MAG: DegT/DnrJ/EryC1/StrS family aminotransferase, partial [Elusimicrobia bacterium]|nr:DegT/DnrJ/EryC1/StrS family aminotransferase [Elusimicrobiota bacterium]